MLDLTALQAAVIAFAQPRGGAGSLTRDCAARRSASTRRRWRWSAIVFLVALTYGFTHVFSGRGAFTHIGALIGTIMVGQCLRDHHSEPEEIGRRPDRRQEPDPRWGELGKQRSVHNNYLTLPVVFLMLSNHYPLFFAHALQLADRRHRAGDRRR